MSTQPYVAPPPPPPPAPRRDRKRLIAVAAGASLGAVVAVLFIALRGTDSEERAGSPPTGISAPAETGSATAPTTASESPSPAPSPPAGETVQLPAGIEVLVPEGWKADFAEGSKSVFLSDGLGNSVFVIGGEGDQAPGDAADTLAKFQNAFLSPDANLSDIQVTGPTHLDPVSPVTSYAQLTYSATFNDTQGRHFPRQGRMDAVLRDDGGALLLQVESKGGQLEANEAEWGPIVDSALTSFGVSD